MTPPDDLLLPLPHSRIYLPLPPSLPQAAPLQEALPLLQTLAKALGLYVLPDPFASKTTHNATAPPPGPSLSPGSGGFVPLASPPFSPGPAGGDPQGAAASSWVDWAPQAAHLVCLHLLVMALGARLVAVGFGASRSRRWGSESEPAEEEAEGEGEGEAELGQPHRRAELPSEDATTMRLQPLLPTDLSDPSVPAPVSAEVVVPGTSQWRTGRCLIADGTGRDPAPL